MIFISLCDHSVLPLIFVENTATSCQRIHSELVETVNKLYSSLQNLHTIHNTHVHKTKDSAHLQADLPKTQAEFESQKQCSNLPPQVRIKSPCLQQDCILI